MKKYLTVLAIIYYFSFPVLLYGQQGFIKGYGSTLQESSDFYDVVVDNDTIVLYGLAWDENWIQGIRFSKIDTFGNIIHEAIYVDSVNTLTTAPFRKTLISTSDGGYAMMGSAGLPTIYLLKVNHDLSLDFIQKYVAQDSVTLLNTSLVEVTDGYLLVGTQRIDSKNKEILVVRTDLEGNDIWRKIYDPGPEIQANPFVIHSLDNNTFVIGGVHALAKSSGIIGTWNKSYLLCIDSLGNMKWDWESDDAPDRGWIKDFELLEDSSWICISGTWEELPAGGYGTRPMVLRMDKDFNVIWKKILGTDGGGTQFSTDLERLPDGNYLFAGHIYDDDAQKYKGVTYKFSPPGDSIWMRWDSVFSGDSDTRITATDILSSGSIIAVGYGFKTDGTYGFVMKITPDGCIDTLNCWPVADYEPFTLENEVSTYPNPFSDYLTVNISAYPQNAYIYFYDVMGRFLRKERVRHGTNELDVSDFPKGWFFMKFGMMEW